MHRHLVATSETLSVYLHSKVWQDSLYRLETIKSTIWRLFYANRQLSMQSSLLLLLLLIKVFFSLSLSFTVSYINSTKDRPKTLSLNREVWHVNLIKLAFLAKHVRLYTSSLIKTKQNQKELFIYKNASNIYIYIYTFCCAS